MKGTISKGPPAPRKPSRPAGHRQLRSVCVHIAQGRLAAVRTARVEYCSDCARAALYRNALGLILDLGLGPRSKIARAYRALSGPRTGKG